MKINRKLTISINFAILFCAMTLGIIFVLDMQSADISLSNNVNNVDMQASILLDNPKKEKTEDEKFLKNALINKDMKSIKELAEIEDVDGMFTDLSNIDELFAFDTDDVGDDGVILSFSGVANNVIHPFHGFFEKKNEALKWMK